MATVIISASSRKDGDTAILVNELMGQANWDVINLIYYNVGYYDYSHQNREDDYLKLMRSIIEKYDTYIFVTPIYWYAMSGMLKVFFDRFTDLLEIEKDLGWRLRGKRMAVTTTSIGENLGEAFWLPFSETAKYLEMKFSGGLHTIMREEKEKAIRNFLDSLARP